MIKITKTIYDSNTHPLVEIYDTSGKLGSPDYEVFVNCDTSQVDLLIAKLKESKSVAAKKEKISKSERARLLAEKQDDARKKDDKVYAALCFIRDAAQNLDLTLACNNVEVSISPFCWKLRKHTLRWGYDIGPIRILNWNYRASKGGKK